MMLKHPVNTAAQRRPTGRADLPSLIATGVSVVVASGVGAGGAALLAAVTPQHKWTWMWIGAIPLGIALEIGFQIVVGYFEAISRFARTGAIVSLLIAFYVVWFTLRPI
jgi:hypothetical protein